MPYSLSRRTLTFYSDLLSLSVLSTTLFRDALALFEYRFLKSGIHNIGQVENDAFGGFKL